MLKRYFSLLKKDIITGFRNYFFYVVIFVAIVFAAIINFVIPEDAEIKPSVYYFAEYEGENKEIFQDVISKAEAVHSNVYRQNSREEIVQNMKKNFNSIGMVIRVDKNKPTVEFIMQGYENDQAINTLVLAMKDDIDKIIREDIEIDTLLLKNYTTLEKIPLNKSALPLFLTMEPTLLGLVMIAAFIFMEKDEGTIKAYKVSPGKMPEYIASKITLMLILGWISTILCTVLVVGFDVDFLSLLAIVAVGSIFASALGLIIASFFDNISQSIIWILVISIVFSLSSASYFVPSFAPLYIRILPTYPLQFALREVLFPTGNIGLINSTLVTFSILSIISFILAVFAYRRNLAKN